MNAAVSPFHNLPEVDEEIKMPAKLKPVFDFSKAVRIRGAWGGRGSGKTRTFAKMAAVVGYRLALSGKEGVILCGREFMNSLEDSSMAEVKAAIKDEPWLAEFYDIGEKYIRTRCKRIKFLFAGLRHNLDSIKSKSKIHILWIDEAEPVSETAWTKVIPTVREEGSEIWVTWNPEVDGSPTDQRFRKDKPDDALVVEINFRDNPWFPDVLNRDRKDDKRKRPEKYPHIWEGGYSDYIEGAYYADLILQAREEGRVSRCGRDPLMSIKVFCDLGGTGAKSDAFVMWVAQFIGKEVRVLDYYERVGQPLSAHLAWLRRRRYLPDDTTIWLPHDGSTHDRVMDVSFESAFYDAGYEVEVVPNQGKGAAAARIEAGRRLMPMCWFNAETTEKGGLKALGYYHEKIDEERKIGLGPEHDWSSHGADSYGLMGVVHASHLEEVDDLDEEQFNRPPPSWRAA